MQRVGDISPCVKYRTVNRKSCRNNDAKRTFNVRQTTFAQRDGHVTRLPV